MTVKVLIVPINNLNIIACHIIGPKCLCSSLNDHFNAFRDRSVVLSIRRLTYREVSPKFELLHGKSNFAIFF